MTDMPDNIWAEKDSRGECCIQDIWYEFDPYLADENGAEYLKRPISREDALLAEQWMAEVVEPLLEEDHDRVCFDVICKLLEVASR